MLGDVFWGSFGMFWLGFEVRKRPKMNRKMEIQGATRVPHCSLLVGRWMFDLLVRNWVEEEDVSKESCEFLVQGSLFNICAGFMLMMCPATVGWWGG